jgi:uncharacterized membrane protein YbhN (UPF0104 family)
MTGLDVDKAAPLGEEQPSVGKRLLRAGAFVAVLVFVFGWLIPQIIDYELVWDALTSLTLTDLLVLTLLSALRIPTEAMVYRAMLPGLRIKHGSEAYLSSNVAANVMPPPASSIIQYAYFRADGFDSQASMTGAVGTFVFPQGARIALPIVAFVVLLVAGQADGEALIITTISVVLVGLVSALLWKVGKSEKSARWVGAQLGRFVSWVMIKLHKDPVGDLGDQVVDFRDNAYTIVRRRWPMGSIAVALNLLLTYLILVASLRAVGVESSELGLVLIFASFAVAFFAGVVIPITGSGLGVVDVVMISALSASATGGVDENVIVAAVVLWRLFYGLLVVIPGALILARFSKQNAELLRGASTDFKGDSQSVRPEGYEGSTDPFEEPLKKETR